ncbi:hypothetical protein LA080_010042 [Diaporthe eres]|uniref:BZIP domain-containing protein n=1 Tax=Diaporthe vaccinii TaxID=105482 RepID=A0ABR4F7U4_9PEZI|nr:hypothetical protein LA080_010042 [Diaporthe eres]
MGPDTTGGSETRPAPRATKRNSAIRKEQNRNASRIYRERRKQRLALLDRLLEKDQDQALPASSQESNSTGPASSQLENAQTLTGLTPSAEPDLAPLVQPSSLGPLSEGVDAVDPSALGDLSFDASWPLSSNDPIWNIVADQDGASSVAQPHPELPTLGPSPSSIPGYTANDQSSSNEEIPELIQRPQVRRSPATTTLSQADIFFTTPGQHLSMYLLDRSSPQESSKGKGKAPGAASPSSSSRLSTTLVPSTRSPVTTPCALPGEDSLGEFMQHLMNLRLPDVKRVIFVQQNALFAAVMDNSLAIGVMNGSQAIFDDEAGSPFNRDWVESKGSMQLADVRSKFSGAPRDLQPVDVQITVEHHVYLDVIPFPSFRERALKAIAHDPPLFDEDELCCDICSREGLIVWGSQGNNQGMEACRPWDMRSWEPKPWFLRKYHFLAGGWDDEMWRASRWWHMMRNERIPAGPVSWASSA